jgi:hypothetical protein
MTQKQKAKHEADFAARVPVPEVDVETELKTMAAPRDLPRLTWVNLKTRANALGSHAGKPGQLQEQIAANEEWASRVFADEVRSALLEIAREEKAQ